MSGTRIYINEKTIKKNGTVAVYAMVYINGKSIKINTGVSVELKKFDTVRHLVKGKTKEAEDANLIIISCLARINEIQVRYRLQQKPLTPDLLIREYKNPTYYVDFYAWMDDKLKERLKHKEIGFGSEKCQRGCLNKLKRYKKNLSFAEIDLKFITGFRNHCRSSLHNNANTTAKTLDSFQTYMNIAKRDELISANPFDNFSFSGTEPLRIFLTEKELKKLVELYDKNSLPTHLQRTLRHYLFMCLTGVRISDFSKLKTDHVQENVLKFVPFKTRAKKQAELHVPLIEKAKQLIADECSSTVFLFDAISDQKLNEQLKDVAIKAKIKKKITNHSARHTFATIFLEKTSDVATLQRILGHSQIRETMLYVHIGTKKISDQMKNFDRLINL